MVGKTVCVVGAGTSGIAAVKECVKQGLEPTCFDIYSEIGGIWRPQNPSETSYTPALWDKLVTNSSKYASCFSDFPFAPSVTPYASQKVIRQYLIDVVDHFNLRQYFKLSTRVVKIRRSPDYETTGRWEVYTCGINDDVPGDICSESGLSEDMLGKCQKQIFDNVIMGTGYFSLPRYPIIPGMDTFQGKISHSFTYQNGKPFEGRNVLVIGNKFSGVDICSDVSNVARTTSIALGVGTWILPRCNGGVAIDQKFTRSMLWSRNARVLLDKLFINLAQAGIDHYSSGIAPKEPPSGGAISCSDDLQVKIFTGLVKTYGKLKELRGRDAIFEEGHVIKDVDDVILCTGFEHNTPILDFPLYDDDGKMESFLVTIPINQKHFTLAVIGNYSSDGPMITQCESHARLAAMVMSGRHKLPSQDVMKKDAAKWNAISFGRKKHYKDYYVPGTLIQECLAIECGFYPSFWKVFFRDPVLAFRNWYGPIFGVQYRLVGPDSQWEKARERCYQFHEEGLDSMRNRPKVKRIDFQRKGTIFGWSAFFGVCSVAVLVFYKRDSVATLFA